MHYFSFPPTESTAHCLSSQIHYSWRQIHIFNVGEVHILILLCVPEPHGFWRNPQHLPLLSTSNFVWSDNRSPLRPVYVKCPLRDLRYKSMWWFPCTQSDLVTSSAGVRVVQFRWKCWHRVPSGPLPIHGRPDKHCSPWAFYTVLLRIIHPGARLTDGSLLVERLPSRDHLITPRCRADFPFEYRWWHCGTTPHLPFNLLNN